MIIFLESLLVVSTRYRFKEDKQMTNKINKEDIKKDVTANEGQITIDFGDLDSIRDAMDNYHHLETMIFGKTQDDELICISIYEDKILTETYQDNGWTRIATYHRDGSVEESFRKETK